MIFMVDRVAEYSIVTQPIAPLTSQQIQVMEVTSIPTEKKSFTQTDPVSLEDIP